MIENDLYYEETSYQFFTSNFTPDGYACLRDRFLGPYRTERNPLAVETGVCEVPGQKGGNHCGVLQKNVTLAPGEEARLLFLLGEGGLGAGKAAKSPLDTGTGGRGLCAPRKVLGQKALLLTGQHPERGHEHGAHIWNLYQSEINVMFSRFTSFIEVGGRVGLGYRDTAQDAMMVPHSNPEKCRSRPIELLRALTKEGYGLHLFEPRWFEKDAPQQSFKSPTVVPTPDKSQIVHGLKDACADDALWLVPAVVQYVKETGELSFLGESVTYADGGESAMVSFLHVWALDNFVQLASRLGRTVDAAVAAGVITEHNPTNEYIDSILSAIDVEAIKNAQLRIALDPMYGVSQTSLSMILMTCRCDLEIIHDRHDTLFGGKLPAPNEDTLGPQACASAVPV